MNEFEISMLILVIIFLLIIFIILGSIIKNYCDTKNSANSWGYYNRFNREQRRIRDKKKGRY